MALVAGFGAGVVVEGGKVGKAQTTTLFKDHIVAFDLDQSILQERA